MDIHGSQISFEETNMLSNKYPTMTCPLAALAVWQCTVLRLKLPDREDTETMARASQSVSPWSPEDCLQHQTVCYRRDIQKAVGISQIQITSETHPATSESCFQILLKWSHHSIASGDSTCVTCAKFGLNQHDLFYSYEDLSAYVHCLP